MGELTAEEGSRRENQALLGISSHHQGTLLSTVYLSKLRILLKITIGKVQQVRISVISLGVECRGIALA